MARSHSAVWEEYIVSETFTPATFVNAYTVSRQNFASAYYTHDYTVYFLKALNCMCKYTDKHELLTWYHKLSAPQKRRRFHDASIVTWIVDWVLQDMTLAEKQCEELNVFTETASAEQSMLAFLKVNYKFKWNNLNHLRTIAQCFATSPLTLPFRREESEIATAERKRRHIDDDSELEAGDICG